MRIEDLTVALRPRTAWEALELGIALVRRHVGAIWKPWLCLSLPVLILVNALAWSIDAIWLAGIVMWWSKPWFDRVPLFVLSRAVFGQVPTLRQTLRAQLTFGRRWWFAYLTWRRLSPVRSLYLPVDLLEGGVGEEARARRRALGAPVYGVGSLLTTVFLHFELALVLGMLAAAMLFVPNEFLQETAARLWNVLEAQPAWLQLCLNAVAWLAITLVEPFYVGAGFGLYLNRRTQIEAWDIEMALRRLRARLSGPAAGALLLLATFGLVSLQFAHAADDPPRRPSPGCPATASYDDDVSPTMREVFGDALVDDAGWRQAVKRAYEDPKVSPKRTVQQWVPKNPRERQQRNGSGFDFLGRIFAMIGEYGLWFVFGLIVLALLITAPKWLRHWRETTAREDRQAGDVHYAPAEEAQPLPDDVPTTARRLWRAGRDREALALVYRAAVQTMTQRAQVVLVPGATEAHTLRASRQMPQAEDRAVFARAVRTWQIAAYAHGMPAAEEFEELLTALTHRFAWSSAGAAA